MKKKEEYELSQIGNMDETPVWFDMPTSRTVSHKGQKTVMIKTSSHEKTRFTVLLSCLADGTKVKPTVIFKRKTLHFLTAFSTNPQISVLKQQSLESQCYEKIQVLSV